MNATGTSARGLLGMMVLLLGLAGAGSALEEETPEARITLDVKEADIHAVTDALVRVAGLQAVFDPGISCRLTVRVTEERWQRVFAASLGACGLAYEAAGTVIRIATPQTLSREAADRRRLAEAQASRHPSRVTQFRLSYARAQEMAPLLQKLLGDRVEVTYDERTNTLIILD